MKSENIRIYECECQLQDVGREAPEMASPLRRDGMGNLRIVDVGDVAYLHLAEGEQPGDWIDLFEIPNGHGAQHLGHFVKVNFSIRPI
ncbi:hypothetical protein IWQ49_005740 [Labrenzia sp. EL_126]|nr:hypothetical protein [Labrenzia sp. EL_126]